MILLFRSYFQTVQRVIACINRATQDKFLITFIENQAEYICYKIKQDAKINLSSMLCSNYEQKRYKNDAIIFRTPQDNLIIYIVEDNSLWHIYKKKN